MVNDFSVNFADVVYLLNTIRVDTVVIAAEANIIQKMLCQCLILISAIGDCMPPFDYCQHVEDGSKVKCGVHGAPTCERCIKEWVDSIVKEKISTISKQNNDITKGEFETQCCGITIGSHWDFCPRCGTYLW